MAHAIVLCLCALALLGAMPFTFFRRGRFTTGWLLTATPFALVAAVLIAGLSGAIAPLALPSAAAAALPYVATPLAAAAIGLIAMTIGVHRAPVSMWHQEQDQPHVLVTSGPYARVRHPFYAAFILLLLACTAAFPHATTMLVLGLGVWQLNRTAGREERRLLASELGREYSTYMKRVHRFVPTLIGVSTAVPGDALSRRRARARSRRARRASTPPAS